MKLATFTHEGWTRIGLADESAIVDLAAAVPNLPQEMCAILRAGRLALDAAQDALANRSARLRLSLVRENVTDSRRENRCRWARPWTLVRSTSPNIGVRSHQEPPRNPAVQGGDAGRYAAKHVDFLLAFHLQVFYAWRHEIDD